MSDDRKQFGQDGENIALEFLKSKGLKWRASNFKSKWGEVDLIMKDGRTLVFVEVKRRQDKEYGEPEEAVTRTKMKHMIKSALDYMQKTSGEDQLVRFDVVSIGPQGIRHYPDAFSVEENYYY